MLLQAGGGPTRASARTRSRTPGASVPSRARWRRSNRRDTTPRYLIVPRRPKGARAKSLAMTGPTRCRAGSPLLTSPKYSTPGWNIGLTSSRDCQAGLIGVSPPALRPAVFSISRFALCSSPNWPILPSSDSTSGPKVNSARRLVAALAGALDLDEEAEIGEVLALRRQLDRAFDGRGVILQVWLVGACRLLSIPSFSQGSTPYSISLL